MDLMTYLLAIQKIQEVSSDTTYTLTADVQNKTIVLTPSVGTAQVITVPYATDASTVNGKNVPELENGKIPASYLPSYVDDVEEYEDQEHFPSMGESNKIYIDLTTNKIYRWSGTTYVEISESLALGETSSTAFRGDHGKTAYDHSLITSGNPHNVTKTDIGLDNVGNFKAVSTVASQGLTTTEQENVKANIGLGVAADKDIDTSIEESSQSTNLPTTKAVSDFVQTQTDKVVGTIKSVSNLPAPIASFSGAAALPMAKLEVSIEAVQDLHGYDAPWVGGAGKNKFPIATATSSGTQNIFSKQPLSLSAGSYVLSFNSATPTTNNMSISFFNGDTQVRGSDITPGTTTVNFTFDQNITSVTWYVREAVSLSNIMIESGSTATTFAPYSNICPIIGWDEVNMSVSGVNVWNEEWRNGYYNNGVFIYAADGICCKNKIPIKPNTTLYYVKNFDINTNFYYTFYDKNGDFLRVSGYDSSGRIAKSSSGAISVPNGAYFMTFNMGSGYGTTYNNDISINYPSTDTSYHAYNGHTYTLDLDGTRYGGKVDLVSGVMTVEKVGVNMGTLNWGKSSLEATILFIAISDRKEMSPMICSKYKYVQDKGFGLDFGTISDSSSSSYTNYIFVRNQDFSGKTATECASILNGTQLVYELATPLTIQLTPTVVKALLVSNVWSDTGNILDAQYISYEYDKICAKYSENIIPTDDFALNTTTGDITTDGDIIRKNGYWGDTYGGTHTSLIDAIDDLYNLIQKNNS